MIKKIVWIGFISLFMLSCKSNYTKIGGKNANYIPYYLEVENAKKKYESEDYVGSFTKLDSLFNYYKPKQTLFKNELDIYCELALKFNKTKRLSQIVKILVTDYGYDIALNNDSVWVNVKNKINYSEKDLKEMHIEYEKNLDISYRDSIIAIFQYDQKDRRTNSKRLIDSLDRQKEHRIINLIMKKGYPTEKKVGGNTFNDIMSPSYISVLLKHISLEGVKRIEPVLLEELKKGNCSPIIYAEMLDVRKIVAKEESPFEYFGTISNVKPTNLIATNKARKSIGLPDLKQ